MSDFPIRCLSCNKVIGGMWNQYKSILRSGKDASDAFVSIGVRRYCCKRMFLGHVEIIDKLLLYSENDNNHSDEKSATK